MTVFGEVKFYSSRAFLDDDVDDEDDEYQTPVVALVLREEVPAVISRVLVAFGGLAVGFCQEEFLDDQDKQLGEITSNTTTNTSTSADNHDDHDNHDHDDQKDVTQSCQLAKLFVKDGTLFVLCQDKRDSDLANQIAAKILKLSTAPVMVLTTQHMSKLKTARQSYDNYNTYDVPVMSHYVATAAWPEKSLTALLQRQLAMMQPVLPLPQPAVIDSLPAAVVIACALRGLPCALFVCYTETISSEDVDAVRDEFLTIIKTQDMFATILLNETRKKKKGVKRRGGIIVPSNYT